MLLFGYCVTLLVFLALDIVWLGIMGHSYRAVLGPLMAPEIRWGAAGLFYLLYILGLTIFVLRPGRRHGGLWVAVHGALFGLFAYATYDLTNLATLARWTTQVTIQDIVWGMVVSAIASLFGWVVMRGRGRRRP